MKAFLQLVAQKIIDLEEQSSETAVILPNKRSIIFLKDYLKKTTNKNFWLPEFYDSDTFFQKATEFTRADTLQLSLDLYQIHKRISQGDHRSLDDFLLWAPTIIADFNDVDLNRADPEQLFQHLSANKAMQEWNLDGSPLTSLQNNYLNFYRSLFDYYKQLKKLLLSRKQGYPGLIYRHLAEHFLQYSTNWPWKKFLVAGMNAFSPSETLFFKQLNGNYQVDFLWDVDHYYYSTSPEHPAHNPEPGRFIHDFVQQLQLPPIHVNSNRLLTDEKAIEFIGVQGEIAQTKYIAQWLDENKNKVNANTNQPQKTALVLADEQILVPLLNALPSDTDDTTLKYNITMGYPLRDSPFDLLIKSWANTIRNSQLNSGNLLTKKLLDFIKAPVIASVLNNTHHNYTHQFTKIVIEQNISLVSWSELKNIVASLPQAPTKQLELLLQPCDGQEFTNRYLELLTTYCLQLKNTDFLHNHQLKKAIEVTTTLSNTLKENSELLSLRVMQKIMTQFIGGAQVSMIGEPLQGIQVMGILETRNLDFDNLLVLGANEGFLPTSDKSETFIPYDIRHRFNMPLPKDSHDIMAYHFYRMLQRANQVTYLYNTSTASLGSNDESRYLLQVENELCRANPNISLTKKQLIIPTHTNPQQQGITVIKTNEILHKLRNKAKQGLSPSALSTYINCPLRFYFRYALGVKPNKAIEQNMESNTFGSLVHGALENIYKPLVNKPIDPNILKENLAHADKYLIAEYRKYFIGSTPIKGKNLLLMEVSKHMIEQNIKNDCKLLEKQPRILVSVEQFTETSVAISVGNIRLSGTIDRIDKTPDGKELRIIDYKSGNVESKHHKIDNIEDIVTNPDHGKSFQLMLYALMYSESNPNQTGITAGNISLRNFSQGFTGPKFNNQLPMENMLPDFKLELINLLEKIYNKDEPFVQTTDEKACLFCDYKAICNKP